MNIMSQNNATQQQSWLTSKEVWKPYLYISPGIIFLVVLVSCVLKVGNSCSQICLATIQHLVSNLFYLTMQKILGKSCCHQASNIIQCCCCCGKNPTLFLSSDNKKIRQMTSLQFLEEGGKREQVDEAAWYFFWRQKSSFCLADDLFLRSCYLRDGLISAAQSSSPRSKFAIVTKKRGPSSSSLGGKRLT